jgi:hypothetical protein
MPRLFPEPRLSIPALLRGPEFVLEERVVLRTDYGEIVGHGGLGSFLLGNRVRWLSGHHLAVEAVELVTVSFGEDTGGHLKSESSCDVGPLFSFGTQLPSWL